MKLILERLKRLKAEYRELGFPWSQKFDDLIEDIEQGIKLAEVNNEQD